MEKQNYLLTDLKGRSINLDILPFIGKPSELTGTIKKMDDWYVLKINPEDIKVKSDVSKIY